MADIEIRSNGSRRKPLLPKVDLTPMVDLGFILITFFMYTTTMTESKALVLDKPYNPPPKDIQTKFIDTSTITIIPVDNNNMVYYHGLLDNKEEMFVTGISGLRDVLLKKRSALKHLPETYSKQARELQVIIKPADNSTYSDFVSILDEMLINKVVYYAVTDINTEEDLAIKARFIDY